MDRQELSRRKAYREFVKERTDIDIDIDIDMDNQIRSATNGNYVGNKQFQEQIAQAIGRRVTKAKAGRPKKE